jgi:transposase
MIASFLGMASGTTRKVITTEIWKKLEPLVRQAKHSAAGAPAVQPDRDFIEAVLWIARTGSPWRDLPPQAGHWNHVYVRFRTWEKRGVWKRLWQLLQEDSFADARLLFIDSTSVRAHQHAAGAPKKTAATKLWDALGAA